MARYRKKPVEVDVVQWTGYNLQEVVDFLGGRDVVGGDYAGYIPGDPSGHADPADVAGRSVVLINTLEGIMRCPVGHWVIEGIRGEHYAVEPGIFELTYEEA